MNERIMLSVGLIVIVAAIYFGYMQYQKRLVVYDGGSSNKDAPADATTVLVRST